MHSKESLHVKISYPTTQMSPLSITIGVRKPANQKHHHSTTCFPPAPSAHRTFTAFWSQALMTLSWWSLWGHSQLSRKTYKVPVAASFRPGAVVSEGVTDIRGWCNLYLMLSVSCYLLGVIVHQTDTCSETYWPIRQHTRTQMLLCVKAKWHVVKHV